MVIVTLVHFDNTHKNIEDTFREVNNIEEGKGIMKGINSENLHTLKRAMEIMKLYYLKLLKIRDIAIKHAEDKEEEVDEPCFQL